MLAISAVAAAQVGVGGSGVYGGGTGGGGGNGDFHASQLALVKAEDFGAVGDWNGTTGTDNTTALQNAINSLQTGGICGQVLLQAKSYKITGTLSITSSCVGIKGTAQGGALGLVGPSAIVMTSASADIIDVAGVLGTSLEYNTFDHFAVERTVAPTGTAAGLSFSYVAGADVTHVQSMDSARGFYFHDFPSRGVSKVEDCLATWGFGSVTGYSGNTYSGFYLDSADGHPMFSIRARHNQASSNLGSGANTRGFDVEGTAVEDVMVYGFESAAVQYGIYVSHTGSTANSSSDLHFYGSIDDGSYTSAIYVSGLSGSTSGAIEFNGGWAGSNNSSGNGIDIESSSGVTVTNMQIGGTYANQLFASGSSSLAINDNNFFDITAKGIVFSGTTGSSIAGNAMLGKTGATHHIELDSTSSYNAVANNALSGVGTVGISTDATSAANTGFPTNAISTSITAPFNDLGANPYVQETEDTTVVPPCGQWWCLITHDTAFLGTSIRAQASAGGASSYWFNDLGHSFQFFMGGSTAGGVNSDAAWFVSNQTSLNLKANTTVNLYSAGSTTTPDISLSSHMVNVGRALQSVGTKFTTSGCSVSATTGGATAGTFTLGANSCTVVITMNGATGATANNGWSCDAHDRTASTVLIGGESSSTTTTASFAIPAGAGATDVISFNCMAF